MKAKGMVEVARALIASAKSRWVPQRLWLQYLTGSQIRIERLWLDARWEAISRSGAEVGRGKQGGGGTQEGLKEVRGTICSNATRFLKQIERGETKRPNLPIAPEKDQFVQLHQKTWWEIAKSANCKLPLHLRKTNCQLANCTNCERGQ